MAKHRRSRIPGVSFSARRALGVTRAKQSFARKTGIPTTRSGRQRKMGGLMGCLVPVLLICVSVVLLTAVLATALASEVEHLFAQVSTKKGPLNMRASDSSKASVVAKIPNETVLEVTAVNDTWYKCTYKGQDGYVMSDFLTLLDASQFATLSLGDKGKEVKEFKKKLQELYYIDPEAKITDGFDADTETAVKQFQAKNAMEETGIASPELQALMTWGEPKSNLTSKKMTVKIKCVCAGYNSVGSSWYKYFTINDEPVSNGDKVDIVLDQSIAIFSKLTEKDSKPDVGSAKDEVEITQEYYDNGFTIEQKVGVKENSGRYKGNKAVWTVNFEFVP